MSTVYFISDVHFGQNGDETNKMRKVRSFFEHVASTAQALYIVGDYFDFWFEYRDAIPKACVAGYRELIRLKDRGVEIHYLLGNHDQWARDWFERDLGARVYRQPTVVGLFGKTVLLHHGDGVSELDRRYLFYKRLFHNRLSRFLFRWVHPDIGLRLGRYFSDGSKLKDSTYQKYEGDCSFYPWLSGHFNAGIDLVVMGHHHLPVLKPFDDCHTYVNLGDWINHFSYLEMKPESVELKFWNGGQ